jgi:hypothetical protein
MYRNDRGREIFVSGADVEARYAADADWTPVTEKAAPDGDPTDSWTVAQLTAWAGDNGVDVPAGPKPAVVEAVLTALSERKAKAEADAKAAADAAKN